MKIMLSIVLSLITLNSIAQNKISYIKMQRTACFGRCPEYTVELYKNGQIVYVGKKNVEMIGTHKGSIPIAKMNKFFKEVGKYKITSLLNVYKSKASDLPRLNFTFVNNGKTKSIKNGESGPAYLEIIGEKIDSLIADIDLKIQESSRIGDASGSPIINLEVSKDKTQIIGDKTEAEFPSGQDAMMNFIRSNIRYPETAKELGVEGRVIVGFTIDPFGKIKNIKIQRGIGHGCDEEAMRIIEIMPNWEPATINGVPSETQMNLPIYFKLN